MARREETDALSDHRRSRIHRVTPCRGTARPGRYCHRPDNLRPARGRTCATWGNPRFRFVVGDVLDPETVAALMSRCDVVFHLAAAVGVKRIIDHPLASIQNNLRGTEVVLEQADRFGKKVLLASTSEVYGKNGHGPLHEDSDRVIGSTTITRWLYATTKACDEFMALAYHRARKLPVVILRFFNTVGPRQTGQYGMVVPRFVQQALLGEPITIYGDGKQTRCFTDVADTVRCVVALADNPRAEGRVFNIGNGREISIEELARQVIAITRSGSPIVYIPYEEAYEAGFEDMRRRVPNTDRLRETIGFAQASHSEQMLRRIISHFELTLPAPAPAVGRMSCRRDSTRGCPRCRGLDHARRGASLEAYVSGWTGGRRFPEPAPCLSGGALRAGCTPALPPEDRDHAKAESPSSVPAHLAALACCRWRCGWVRRVRVPGPF